MTSKLMIAAAATAIAYAFCGGATAQPAGVEYAPQVKVSFADLNLGSAAGRAQLDQRIRAAAASMCGPAPSIRDLAATQAWHSCMQATAESSLPTVQEAARLQIKSAQQVAEAGSH